MKNFRGWNSRKRGFTLIELLVTISIIVIITMGGLANYFLFDAKQRLRSDAKDLLALIEKVRARAMAMEYPKDCVNFQSYSVVGTLINPTLTIKATCNGIDYPDDPVKVMNVSELSEAFTLTFLAQTGETLNRENKTITLVSKRDPNRSIAISIDGVVVDNNQISE